MRIVHVNLQTELGGAEIYTLQLAEGLVGLGHSVTLVCHPVGKLIREAGLRGLTVETVSASSQLDLRAAAHLAKVLRTTRPDVLHLQTSREYISGTIAARLARVPVVVASRHMLVPVKPTMKALFRSIDSVVVLSRAVRDNLVRHSVPEARINVIYAGIDVESFKCAADNGSGLMARAALGVSAERLLIGMAGRMVEGKGHRSLLEALASPALKGSLVTLALAGDGPLRGELEALATALGIADRVVFAGYYPDLPAFMAALDFYVMPSTYEEVMPLVLMEAMAAGCPVVATDVGGVREMVDPDRNGLLTPPGDPTALAEALHRLSEDPCLRARLGASGQADVLHRFTLSRMVSETEQLYQQLLSEKQP